MNQTPQRMMELVCYMNADEAAALAMMFGWMAVAVYQTGDVSVWAWCP